jgi:hypothetical protein
LTDDDLQVIGGKRDKLIGRIQERYGIAKQRAAEEVDAFLRTLHEQPSYNIRDPDDLSEEDGGGRVRSHTAGGR